MTSRIVGQQKLLNRIDNYSVASTPKSLLFSGPTGCGKHLVAQYFADKLELPLFDITEKISDDLINTIYDTVVPMVYLVDLTQLAEKNQNILLKLVEEPPQLVYMVLLCNNLLAVLPTIVNRCEVLEFETYPPEILKQFTSDAVALMFLKTPGEILSVNHGMLTSMENTCLKIVNDLHLASYINTTTIIDKINYADEFDKYDITIFFRVLCQKFYLRWVDTKNKNDLDNYLFTNDYQKKLLDTRINKKDFMRDYLSRLWVKIHG